MLSTARILFALMLASAPLAVPRGTSQGSAPVEPGASAAATLWKAGERLLALELWSEELTARPQERGLRLTLARHQLEVHHAEAACRTLAPLVPATGASAAPPDEEARDLYARARFSLCDYEGAQALLGDEGEAGVLRVHCLVRLNRLAQADQLLARLLAAQAPASADLRRLEAARLVRASRDAEAARLYEALLEEDGCDAEALFGLGRALIRGGERERGLALLERHRRLAPLLDELDFAERGVDLAPAHAPNHAQVGDIERRIGRLDRARAAYERALELAQPEELTAIALRAARLLEEDLGQVPGALALLARATRRHADVALDVRRGDILQRAGRLAEAIATYRGALERRPQDAAIQERLTRALATGAGSGD